MRASEGEMKNGRLLLADRHLGVLGGQQGLLQDLFDTVVMVSDEQSLMAAAEDRCPDLVIMDLALPSSAEPCLAERLLKSHPGLRLIVLSSHDESAVADRLMAEGAAGFIVRRTIGTDLLPAVRAVIAGGSYVSPAARAKSHNPHPGVG